MYVNVYCISGYELDTYPVKMLRVYNINENIFQFDPTASFDFDFALRHAKRRQHATTLDEKIAKARKQQKKVL